jgi:hypothetical protein
VAPNGSAQGLVTRGTYRSLDPPGGHHARFEIAPQSYRFPAGHKLKLEVAANDAPYYQQDNIPAVVQITGIELTLPLHVDAPRPAGAAQPSVKASTARAQSGSLPATGGGALSTSALALVGCALLLARRPRRFTK